MTEFQRGDKCALIKIVFIIISILVEANGTKASEDTDLKQFTYTAAVVEYQRIANATMKYHEKVMYSTHDYIRILETIKEDIEVILFPEATLTALVLPIDAREVTEVPKPYTEILCNSSDSNYLPFLKQLSCAAVQSKTALVINLIEKEDCRLEGSSGSCPASGFVYHNTDVVLNDEGSVTARYRKYNLFGEPGLSPTPQVEIVNFTTKNNITFGIFTCFDILFQKPALIFPNVGIRNVLFPTMWYSELPYLTALQVQQMWAQENNVTVLSSGANNPREGSGGTGIYVGTKGPLNFTIIGEKGGEQVFVHRVPKIDIIDNPYINKIVPLEQDTDNIAGKLDNFHVMQDPSILSGHTSILLDTNKTETTTEICNGEEMKICCHFYIKLKNEKNCSECKNIYTYHLAAFNGVRSFGGVRNGGIETCAVLACLNTSVLSCGKRFPNYKEVYWPITFEEINVSAEFRISNNRIQYPNSVLASLRPISPQYTLWTRGDSEQTTRRDHILKEAHNKILTFGIFGRDFNRDSPHPNGSDTVQTTHTTTILLCIILILSIAKICQ